MLENTQSWATKPVKIAFLESHMARVSKVKEITFKELSNQLSNPVRCNLKTGPAFIPADIPVGARSKAHVAAVSLLVLDIEQKKQGGPIPPTVGEIAANIDVANFQGCVHTTYNHTAGNPRYRVLILPSRPIKPSELREAQQELAKTLGLEGVMDEACTRPNSLFFFPRIPDVEGDEFEWAHIDGLPFPITEDRPSARGNGIDALDVLAEARLRHQAYSQGIADDDSLRQQITAALDFISADCERDLWLKIIFSILSSGLPDSTDIAKRWSLTAPHRFDEQDFHRDIDSYIPDGRISVATLFFYARNAGYEVQAAAAAHETPPPDQEQKHRYRFPLISPGELASRKPVVWRVNNLLPESGVGVLFGPPTSGKTFLALDLAAHVALGWKWFDLDVRPAAVVYIALEGVSGIAKRVEAWRQSHRVSPLHLHLVEKNFSLLGSDTRMLLEELTEQALGPLVIVVDTLSQATAGADENSGKEMTEVMANVQLLCVGLNALVLLVHHTGKDEARGMRGHSSIPAAADTGIQVIKRQQRCWRVTKNKDGEVHGDREFELGVVQLGSDGTGMPISSCAVLPAAARGQLQIIPQPRGKNQKLVITRLEEIADAKGRVEHLTADTEASAALELAGVNEPAKRAREAMRRLCAGGHLEDDGCFYQLN